MGGLFLQQTGPERDLLLQLPNLGRRPDALLGCPGCGSWRRSSPRRLVVSDADLLTNGVCALTSWCVIAGGHAFVVTGTVDRAVLAHPVFTGVSMAHLASLVEELARPWVAAVEGRRFPQRGGVRRRAQGAGARYRLVYVDRLVVTLLHLRHDLPHAALGVLFNVDRSTVTRAVGEMRRLLAERGFAVPDRLGLRLRTLQDVFAYAQAAGVELRLDATEVQVRRPAAGPGGRRAFVSGKKKQNTMKATVIADHQGRTLWADGLRPGRMHDATAVRAAGITGCFQHFDLVEVLLDDGYWA